jgi:hypothetical protein
MHMDTKAVLHNSTLTFHFVTVFEELPHDLHRSKIPSRLVGKLLWLISNLPARVADSALQCNCNESVDWLPQPLLLNSCRF